MRKLWPREYAKRRMSQSAFQKTSERSSCAYIHTYIHAYIHTYIHAQAVAKGIRKAEDVAKRLPKEYHGKDLAKLREKYAYFCVSVYVSVSVSVSVC